MKLEFYELKAMVTAKNSSKDPWLSAFALLDQDHDQVITKDELDEAVLQQNLSVDFAEIVAALKADFKNISELHKKGWFARRRGITLADILVFEEILKHHANDPLTVHGDWEQTVRHSHQAKADPEMLARISRSVMARVRDISNTPFALYADRHNPLASIRPEAPRQGLVGDCFFLAGLSSVAAASSSIILRSIRDNKNSTYTITFPGDRDEPITIDSPTIVELALYARVSQWGIWPAVMEKAYGTYLAQFSKKRKRVPAENTDAAEHMHQVFDLLTGQMGEYLILRRHTTDDIAAILSGAFAEGRVVGAGRNSDRGHLLDDSGIPGKHAYSVIGWNRDTSLITLRNPWGHVGISERQSDLIGVANDGIFTMDLLHFALNFDYIFYEDWCPSEEILDQRNRLKKSIVDKPHGAPKT